MLPKSKLLKYFQDNRAALTESAELFGDLILVERVHFPEQTTGSGIIKSISKLDKLSAMTSDEPLFWRVLLPGVGYYDDETGADEPLDIEQGDIILSGGVSVKVFSSFPMLQVAESNLIGITRLADVQWRFKGQEAFETFLREFNSTVKAEMEAERGATIAVPTETL